MNEKILVVIPGIGHPNIEKKLEILSSNLGYFADTDFTAYIFQYSQEPGLLNKFEGRPHIQIVREPGIVGDFLRKFITPEFVDSFSHIIILLDDVEIQEGFSVAKLLKFKQTYGLDIVSCSLTHDSKTPWKSMKSAGNCYGRIMSFAELMCYFMDTSTYKRYYRYLIPENPWVWGLDLALLQLGFKVGILDTVSAKHHFGGKGSYSKSLPSPVEGAQKFQETFKLEELLKPKTLKYCYLP